MDALYDALRRLIELAGAFFAGLAKGKADDRADRAETDVEAYKQRERDREGVTSLSDDALERELRDPPN